MRIQKYLDESPLFSLYTAYDQVVGKFQTALKKEEVHFVQALILTGLFFEDRPTQPSEFSKELKVGRSNISHSLRDLEKKQLIERTIHRSDARGYLIGLTKNGRRKASRLIRLFDVTQEKLETAGGKALNTKLKEFIEAYQTG